MTAYSKENAKFPEPSELNRRLDACPEPTAKRKIWLAAEWLAVLVSVAAGTMLLALLAQWAAKL